MRRHDYLRAVAFTYVAQLRWTKVRQQGNARFIRECFWVEDPR